MKGRYYESDPFWDYRQLVLDRAKIVGSMLDLGTGGGEFLASLKDLPKLTCATESYLPNIPIATGLLEPLGVQVVPLMDENTLPFIDEQGVFYLDVTIKSVNDPNFPRVDWMEIWNTVSVVDETEWQAIQDELRTNYVLIQDLIKSTPARSSEWEIGGAMAVIAHTAYHLGEIRPALCTLRP